MGLKGSRYQGQKSGQRERRKRPGAKGTVRRKEQVGERRASLGGGAPMSRAEFGAQDIGEGAAVSEGDPPGLAAEIVILSRVWMSRARRSSKYAGQSGDAALWGPLQLTHREGV